MNDYKQELITTDRKYHLKKLFNFIFVASFHRVCIYFCLDFPTINETWKYFIHSNCHLDSLSQD